MIDGNLCTFIFLNILNETLLKILNLINKILYFVYKLLKNIKHKIEEC